MPTSRLDNISASTKQIAEPANEVNIIHTLAHFLRMVRHRKGVVIVVVMACCLLGGLHYITAPRRYESKASLLIIQGGENTWSTEMSGSRTTRDLMPTYQKLVSSEVVLEEAVKLLPQEACTDMDNTPREKWESILRNNLSVNVQRSTNILDIAYQSSDPRAAASVVDSVVIAYLAHMDNIHKTASRVLLDMLTKQQVGLQKELDAKEAELAAMKANAGELVINDGDQAINVVVQRALKLNDFLIQAHQKRLEDQSQLITIDAVIRNGGDLRQLAMAMVDGAGSEVMKKQLGLTYDDSTVAKMKQQVLADTAALQSASQRYGSANSKVKELQQRIQLAQQYIENSRQNTQAGLQRIGKEELARMLHGQANQQLQQAIEHETAIAASYDQEKQRAIAMNQGVANLQLLEQELTRMRAYYHDVVLDRIKNIDLGQDAGMIRASVTSRPKVPDGPVSPKLIPTAAKSIFAGLLLALALVYVLDILDDRFRSPEDLQIQLRVPVLAMIRKLDPLEGERIEKVHVYTKPNGVESESFRTLRTALALTDGGAKCFVMTSAEPGDGKTTLMANLATAFAQVGQRTLLIDADMRRPGLTNFLDLRGPTGLATALHARSPIAEAAAANLHTTALENLHVLPAGPRQTNAMQLLASERFSELLSWADSQYDQILIDGPPALAVSDAAMIGRLVDGVLLVVRPEKNRRREVIRAVERLRMLGVNVLGTVLNHMSPEKRTGYYGYGYDYNYESGYGHDDGDDNGDGDGDIHVLETEDRTTPNLDTENQTISAMQAQADRQRVIRPRQRQHRDAA